MIEVIKALFTVRIFDASLARSNTNPKKIYCVDHALVKSLSSGILVNSGHLLENLVFMGLRRLYPEVYYFKTKIGREVDFVVTKSEDERIRTETGTIEVVPIWRFLLELPNQGSPNENLKLAKRWSGLGSPEMI